MGNLDSLLSGAQRWYYIGISIFIAITRTSSEYPLPEATRVPRIEYTRMIPDMRDSIYSVIIGSIDREVDTAKYLCSSICSEFFLASPP